MRGDQWLERAERARRRGGKAALACVLVLAAGRARGEAADRTDLHYPEPVPGSAEALVRAPSAETPGGLTLVWFDPRGLVPEVFGPASREVSGIFRGIGVELSWERATADTVLGERTGLEIPVILLPADPSARPGGRRVLGLVQKGASHAVWAFLDNIRWTLGYDPRTTISLRERDELGLALARVVAHEVVHAVAPDEPHSASGLMHQSMGRRFLLGARVPIDPGCVRVFQRSLVGRLSPIAPATAARTEENRDSIP